MMQQGKSYVLAFDTANEVIAIGVGRLRAGGLSARCSDDECADGKRMAAACGDGLSDAREAGECGHVLCVDADKRPDAHTVDVVASFEVQARRASNTQLLPRIDELLAQAGVAREEIACIVCGRGPGSFTGVRIAMATAKGMAMALDVPLVGVSTLDAVTWEAQAAGVRGHMLVVADAMRKEVYPVRYRVTDEGVERLDADHVVAVQAAVDHFAENASADADRAGAAFSDCANEALLIAGDALVKYAELFAPCGQLLSEKLWTPTGRGLLLAFQAAWRAGEADPFDTARHNPAFALPVYTRLSDAEEGERTRLAQGRKTLAGTRGSKHVTMNDTALSNARAGTDGIAYRPLDAAHVADVAAWEGRLMGTDAWNERLVADELGRADRTWWAAYSGAPGEPLSSDAPLVGYAGGWVVDGDLQILKVAVAPAVRRRGIARTLLARVAADARNLGARTCSLEVRASNAGAQALYEALGLRSAGTRPRYYSDREDAVIMQGPLPAEAGAVAGMELQVDAQVDAASAAVMVSREAFASAASASSATSGDAAPAALSAPDIVAPDAQASVELPRPLIFAIESSCDETAAAIVDGNGNLVADVVASQIDFHARFGGVVPEIASRKHIEAICGVCSECLERAAAHLGVSKLAWADLDAISCTYTPGLVGALVVGVAFAKGAAWATGLPFIGVNHLEGHLYANKVGCADFEPPAVVSLVSGGNTLLVHMRDWGSYETLGTTIDDAVGEAFDKVAKALGLGYPGGPVISREAAKGNAQAIAFPRAMLHSGDLRFSLSGLKTAVVTYINEERAAGREPNVPDVCASFQQAVVDVQVAKAKRALEQTGAPTFCLGGGVAANPVLRVAYEKLCASMGVRLVMPPLSACGDNAGMIALVALDRYRQQKFFSLGADAQAHSNLDDPY